MILHTVTNVFKLSYGLALAKYSRESVMVANAGISCTILDYFHVFEDYGRAECTVKNKNEHVTAMLCVSI